MLVSVVLIVVCCLIIWKASDGFETASEYLGRNLSDGVRGATVNAVGSSMPELFTTLFFLFVLKDKDGFSAGIGTTVGSAVFNGMIIPSTVILVVVFKKLASYVEVSKKVILRDGISLLVCELILIFIVSKDSLNWTHGLLLIIIYALYAIYMVVSMTTSKKKDDINRLEKQTEFKYCKKGIFINILTLNLKHVFIKEKINTRNACALLITSMLIIGSACLLLVKSCEWLGDALQVPVYFIAVVLASAATSVPDTILSVKDAKKGNYDDAVSNALGSNIFDLCFALGFPLFIFTLVHGSIDITANKSDLLELSILLFLLSFLAFCVYLFKRKMNKMSAVFLVLIYVLFTVYILGKSANSEIVEQISLSIKKITIY
ncbi:MAG: sodium:calcium antiporter [Tenacibaculum sp.]